MTTEHSNPNPLVNSLQQALYPGKSGAPAKADGDEGSKTESSGWWAFQYDPAQPDLLTMLVTLAGGESDKDSPQGDTDGCLSFYSSRLSVTDVQSLYQWLALQMGQQMSGSGKSTGSNDTKK